MSDQNHLHERLLLLSLLLLFVALPGALVAGCRCLCGGDEALARVVRFTPVTELSLTKQPWTAATAEAELRLGDALRTGEAGRATLEVFGQGTVKIGPRSLVRFGEVPSGGERQGKRLSLTLESGQLEVETAYEGAPPLVIAGPGGERVILGDGTRARWLFDDAEQLRLDVAEGSARVEREGQATDLAAGQSLSLGEAERLALGGQTADAGTTPPPPADAGAPPADAAADAAGDADLVQGLELRSLGGAEVEVRPPGEEGFTRAKRSRLVLEPGTALRVSGSRGLELPGPDGAVVLLRPGATAVFRGTGGGRLSVGLNGGSAEARSGGAGVAALTVPGGSAQTANAGGAPAFDAVVLDASSTRIVVRSGAASVSSGSGSQQLLTGDEVVLGQRELTVTRPRETPPVFTGSAVVHDPQRSGSFTLRFQPIEGCSTYLIEVTHGGSRFTEAVTDRPLLPLRDVEYGDYTWRAACLDSGTPDWSAAREGVVSRRADSSRAELPTKAPSSSLDSDGRSYTVTYQNRLPALTLRWSKAPAASSYLLEVVDDRSGSKLFRGSTPRASKGFPSGFFREGRYYWFFRAEGGERATSPITSAQVTFDNVAPAIQIIEPVEGSAAAGTVRVRGVASVGSTVQANGVDLALGPDFRFDQQVPVGRGGLVIIRATAPRRGTGYYIRHLTGGGGE